MQNKTQSMESNQNRELHRSGSLTADVSDVAVVGFEDDRRMEGIHIDEQRGNNSVKETGSTQMFNEEVLTAKADDLQSSLDDKKTDFEKATADSNAPSEREEETGEILGDQSDIVHEPAEFSNPQQLPCSSFNLEDNLVQGSQPNGFYHPQQFAAMQYPGNAPQHGGFYVQQQSMAMQYPENAPQPGVSAMQYPANASQLVGFNDPQQFAAMKYPGNAPQPGLYYPHYGAAMQSPLGSLQPHPQNTGGYHPTDTQAVQFSANAPQPWNTGGYHRTNTQGVQLSANAPEYHPRRSRSNNQQPRYPPDRRRRR